MGYLLTQIYLYMLAALLLGVALGWLIWGPVRKRLAEMRITYDAALADNARLKAEIEAAARDKEALERRWRDAETALVATGRLSRMRPAAFNPPTALVQPFTATEPLQIEAEATDLVQMSQPTPEVGTLDFVPEPVQDEPARRKAAPPRKRNGRKAAPATDDLQRIFGIGPVNERLLHEQGVRTFSEIAAWRQTDVARMEAVLEIDGRIARERWIEQARLLAAGNEREFAERFAHSQTIG